MRQKTFPEDVACFVCDYWYLILIFLALLFWGFWLLRHLPAAAVPVGTVTPTSTPRPVAGLPTSDATPRTENTTPGAMVVTPMTTAEPTSETTATPSVVTETPVPTPTKPVYIFGVIPVNYSGSDEEFASLANDYINYFVAKSGMSQYFDIQVHVLAASPGMNANSDNILNDLTYYGMNEFPADRYIGITSQDITVEGDSGVVGFTSGDNAYSVVSEASDQEIVAHELGHTYGLCDEYSYDAWTSENSELPNGCPNQLATTCYSSTEMCMGVNTADGLNSMMGASGIPGGYGYNTASYDYLQERFQYLLESVNQ